MKPSQVGSGNATDAGKILRMDSRGRGELVSPTATGFNLDSALTQLDNILEYEATSVDSIFNVSTFNRVNKNTNVPPLSIALLQNAKLVKVTANGVRLREGVGWGYYKIVGNQLRTNYLDYSDVTVLTVTIFIK